MTEEKASLDPGKYEIVAWYLHFKGDAARAKACHRMMKAWPRAINERRILTTAPKRLMLLDSANPEKSPEWVIVSTMILQEMSWEEYARANIGPSSQPFHYFPDEIAQYLSNVNHMHVKSFPEDKK